MEYRGIQLDESVKLYMKNGEFNKRTKEALDKFIDNIEKVNFKVVSYYKGSGKTVKIQCDKGHILPVWTNSFNKYLSCSTCTEGNIKVAKEKGKERLLKMLKKNNHELKSEYINNNTSVLIDFKCNHEPQLMVPLNYMNRKNNHFCTKCSAEKRGLDRFNKAKDSLILLVANRKHKLISEYKGNRKKVIIDFCCGHEPYELIAGNYIREHTTNCPKCPIEKSIRAKNEFVKLLKENGHDLLSEYKRDRDKVLIDFKCDHKPNWIRPYAYKFGTRCPYCSESKGEKIIREWLETNRIKHFTQYKLPNKKWRYDFYIPSENVIIEVQGIQHYKYVEYFHKTKENFYKQANDYDSKWAYARLKLGFNFIEVNYKEGKPELALERFIEAYNEYRPIEEPEKQLSMF